LHSPQLQPTNQLGDTPETYRHACCWWLWISCNQTKDKESGSVRNARCPSR